MPTPEQIPDDTHEEARIKQAYQIKKPVGHYSLFQAGNLFVIKERERLLLRCLMKHGCDSFAGKRVLEIGCGAGYWLRQFIQWGADPCNITGVDLRSEVISTAVPLCPPSVTLRCMNAARLDFESGSFDLVLQSLVFTSVLDQDMKQRIAQEMLRVVKQTGLILWYDFHVNNPWNPNVRGVRKGEIARLFPNCRITLNRVSLALPIAKKLAPCSWLSCYVLDRLRVFNTHYLGVIQKR